MTPYYLAISKDNEMVAEGPDRAGMQREALSKGHSAPLIIERSQAHITVGLWQEVWDLDGKIFEKLWELAEQHGSLQALFRLLDGPPRDLSHSREKHEEHFLRLKRTSAHWWGKINNLDYCLISFLAQQRRGESITTSSTPYRPSNVGKPTP
jgi:hypothetical protein